MSIGGRGNGWQGDGIDKRKGWKPMKEKYMERWKRGHRY